MRRLFSLALTLALCTAPTASAAAPPSLPPGFDDWVAQVMKAFEVPGVAITVVKDGQVVLAKGYGVRKLGEKTPVDDATLFGIASNSKVFTAVALALLVEDGKLEWDAPVVRFMPAFQLWDPWVTRELTVRDLLVHRSGLGLGAGDLLWWPASTLDRAEIVKRLRFIPPATSFRSAYAYDNVLYLVAGQLIEAVTGQRWEDFVTQRILAKAGMTGSTARYADAITRGNVAATHAKVEGVLRLVAPLEVDNFNPAGGILSSASDMAKWLSVLLARGQLADGTRLYSEKTARELDSLVTPLVLPPLDDDRTKELDPLRPNFVGYGLGLFVTDYRGHKVVAHTGGLPGFLSRVVRVPDAALGISVLTNQEADEAFKVFSWQLTDHFLDAPKTDWLAAFQKEEARQKKKTAEALKKSAGARDPKSRPSLPLKGYVATYCDAWYGDITLGLENSRLVMRFSHTPSLVGDLEPWQHDTFVVRWRARELRADAFVTFALDPDGKVEQAKLRAVSPETDFSFDFQDLLLKPVPPPKP